MYIYYPFPGLEDHPIYFQRWTVRVIKYFWGSIGFFLREAKKKFDRPPSRSASAVEGGTPQGGVPPRGGPPLGGVPPSYQRQIFSKNSKKKMH